MLYYIVLTEFISSFFAKTPTNNSAHFIKCCILYSNSLSVLQFDIMLPKYLNSHTCSITFRFISS
jgi:hypothetical protein